MSRFFCLSAFLVFCLVLSFTHPVFAEMQWPQEEHTVLSENGMKAKISTGFDYSSGDYGASEDTDILYIPVTGRLQKGNWTAKLTVSYISIKGPGAVVGNGDTTNGAGGTAVTTESGLGDVVGSVGYTFDLTPETYLDVTGKIKLPTADEDKGLGTGETDYTVNTEITQEIGKAHVYGSAGYKFVGTNSTLNLDDSLILGVGAGTKIGEETTVGASYDWRESASGGENPSEASAYLSHNITRQISAQVYGVTGFSDASPDLGGGMMIGYKFY